MLDRPKRSQRKLGIESVIIDVLLLQSQGSGSISSENRSISPTHSDDSRSVTPPNPPQAIAPPPKKDQPPEKPKPPQRKRRPAPKPPGPTESSRRNSEEKSPSSVSESSEVPQQTEKATVRKSENGLTICHSRNSSDSSGYHEASVLSENCNTSLPRRPKSAFVTAAEADKLSKLHSHSTTNLTKMTTHSKSTTSLAIAGESHLWIFLMVWEVVSNIFGLLLMHTSLECYWILVTY